MEIKKALINELIRLLYIKDSQKNYDTNTLILVLKLKNSSEVVVTIEIEKKAEKLKLVNG